jgi:hypothetical protein
MKHSKPLFFLGADHSFEIRDDTILRGAGAVPPTPCVLVYALAAVPVVHCVICSLHVRCHMSTPTAPRLYIR